MSARHTVVGAGALGSAVARDLVSHGHEVRVLSRRPRSITGAQSVAVEFTDRAALTRELTGSTVVYHCAQPPYHRWAEEFPGLQAAIVDATASAGADLVIADNLYSYGRPGGKSITESSPEQPSSRKGEVRRRMAVDALRAHRAGRLRVALSRPSSYFGPGYDQSGDAVFRRAIAGRPMQLLGRPDALHSFSYVPDVAAAMVALGGSPLSWGRVWIPPVQRPVTQADLARLVWGHAGQMGAPQTRYLRRGGARAIGLVSPVVREIVEMLYEFEEAYVVDSSEFERTFSMNPTPLEDAIDATLAWYRS